MKHLTLSRVSMAWTETLGVLTREDGTRVCLILERPWKNNKPNVSCIPAGEYVCKRVDSPSYGDTFEVTDVEGRTVILFHWGNWPSKSKGCLLTGAKFGVITQAKFGRDSGTQAVIDSKLAFGWFLAETADVDEFKLTIRED